MGEVINTDYLVVGAGAMGLAFVDSLVTGSTKSVTIVDRYSRPGGHWTTAYPFVRLHQPAASYGVNSKRLERHSVEQRGWNKGLADCSSRDDICAYFDEVMKTFLSSGRVRYFSKCEYIGQNEFRSTITDKTYSVGSETRVVDATYSRTVVPSMRPPPYEVMTGVELVTPNKLVEIPRPFAHYTVVGAGKTSMDACLWLLENGIDSSHITWIRPRDAYFLDRAAYQPSIEGIQILLKGLVESTLAASSFDNVVKNAAAAQGLLQLDENIEPTMFHCATVSRLELEALKQIRSVVRKGHVTRITPQDVTLEHGNYQSVPDTLYIDCSAGAIPKMPPVPVFRDQNITLQPVRWCQQTFSAAMIGHVEATYSEDKQKNELCRPVPMPNEPKDFPLVMLQTNLNSLSWAAQPQTIAWLAQCRLDILSKAIPEDIEQRAAYYQQMGAILEASCRKIRDLIHGLPEKDAASMHAQLRGYPNLSARL